MANMIITNEKMIQAKYIALKEINDSDYDRQAYISNSVNSAGVDSVELYRFEAREGAQYKFYGKTSYSNDDDLVIYDYLGDVVAEGVEESHRFSWNLQSDIARILGIDPYYSDILRNPIYTSGLSYTTDVISDWQAPYSGYFYIDYGWTTNREGSLTISEDGDTAISNPEPIDSLPAPFSSFSEEFYFLNNPDIEEAVDGGYFGSAWEHYLNYGRTEGRSYAAPAWASGFNENFYLLNNPDIEEAVEGGYFESGWEHYLNYGHIEGRSYAAPAWASGFNEDFYLLNNPDIEEAVEGGYFESGWEHYVDYGRIEGRSYAAPAWASGFSEEFYLLHNPDIAGAVEGGYFESGWEHFVNYGKNEGRVYADAFLQLSLASSPTELKSELNVPFYSEGVVDIEKIGVPDIQADDFVGF